MTKNDNQKTYTEAELNRLVNAVCSWFVRRDGKYYQVEHLSTKLSRDDVAHISLARIRDECNDIETSRDLLRDGFRRAIEMKHAIPGQTIPIWNGREYCDPGTDARVVNERGAVAVNSWREPGYRLVDEVEPSWGVAEEFLETIFPREAEREMFLNWLAWCLQNESDKPNWAPFLYSARKGTGKSTLCQLVARLFGSENAVTQNNVDKLTGRFNASVLTRKLVVCEELNLRQDSPQGNALKTYLTEREIMTERKGQEAEQIRHCCCFLFTSNHLPLWIEPEDRRYYLIEIDHDGHATGPRAGEFASLVERLYAFMRDDRAIAGLHRVLMERKLDDGFSAKTLNVERDATPLMRRVQGASEQTVRTQLAERLDERGQHAVPEADVAALIRTELGQNVNSTRHMMTELGWSKFKVKWAKQDYARAIWVREGYWVENGKVRGPGGYSQPIAEHLETPFKGAEVLSFEREAIEDEVTKQVTLE
ncbi:DUF5906 domain-containing protein [Roseovarius sp.]|uniref:primase-helicase family protein n=1 Tax=Roseovarius sp. TaxID=1486281 RepID=UPI003D0F8405